MCLLKYTIAVHTCTNETHSLAPLQDLTLILAASVQSKHHAAKVGIKSCRCARECVSFVHV